MRERWEITLGVSVLLLIAILLLVVWVRESTTPIEPGIIPEPVKTQPHVIALHQAPHARVPQT